ncbi:MAG: hypothetical protein R6V62_05935 [Candidatus Fermentibacteraceae bacterium]
MPDAVLTALLLGLIPDLPDAVFVQNSVTVQIDSVYTETTELVVIPLTGRGVARFTTLSVPFRTGWETVELLEARTGLWRSGRRGSDAVVTERPHHALAGQSRLESSMRELLLTMPGLETGDTVVVRTRRVIQRLPLADCYSYHFSPWCRDSVIAGEFTVIDMRNSGLFVEWSPEFGPPDTSGCTLRWSVGPLSPLYDHPLAFWNRPYAVVASHDGQSVSRELHAALDIPYSTDSGLLSEVAAVTGPTPDDMRDWIAGNIEYTGADIGDWPGFTPKPPRETLDDGAGVCRDTAILLVNLIRATGGEAWLAMLDTTGGIPGLVGSRSFDHMVVAVPHGEGFRVLDPSAKGVADGHSYGLRGTRFLPLTPWGTPLQSIPVDGWEDSLKLVLMGTLGDGFVSGSLTVTASGAPAELLGTIMERSHDAYRITLLSRFFGAESISAVSSAGDTLFISGEWSAPGGEGAVLLPGLRDIAFPGTRAAHLLIPACPGSIELDAPAHESLTMVLAHNGRAVIPPAPVTTDGYSCSISIHGDSLFMRETARVLPLRPEPGRILETLLLRSGSSARTVLTP